MKLSDRTHHSQTHWCLSQIHTPCQGALLLTSHSSRCPHPWVTYHWCGWNSLFGWPLFFPLGLLGGSGFHWNCRLIVVLAHSPWTTRQALLGREQTRCSPVLRCLQLWLTLNSQAGSPGTLHLKFLERNFASFLMLSWPKMFWGSGSRSRWSLITYSFSVMYWHQRMTVTTWVPIWDEGKGTDVQKGGRYILSASRYEDGLEHSRFQQTKELSE